MSSPLADKIRPKTLDDVVGQEHILGKDKALRRIIESKEIPNMIFYGPSGVGKTTVASIIAKQTKKTFRKLNGTTASISDIKDIVAELNGFQGINGILLYLDEIQYFNKKQQQTLLEYMENGSITLVASTTENPYFYVYGALLSRSTIFEFKSVKYDEVKKAVKRGFNILSEEKNKKIVTEPKVIDIISSCCNGDIRKSINAVELAVLASETDSDIITITEEYAKELSQGSSITYDKEGDDHYDIISAFQKSMRGSDSDAAIHYLARLLSAGDLASACRRLLVCACEDVGLAYPQIIPIVKACVDSALQLGLPEARLPLADAVILVAQAPKSNSAHNAIEKAMEDVAKGKSGNIPRCLQNKHCDGDDTENKGQFYLYPHNFPNRWVNQQYLPDTLKDEKYYIPAENKTEQSFNEYWKKIKNID